MSTRNDKNEPLAADNDSVDTPPEVVPSRVSSTESTSPVTAHSDVVGERGERAERGRAGGARGERQGFIERTREFIIDTRAELRRVTWPSATEVKNTTIITIIAVIFFAAYLFVVDRSFTLLIAQIERLVGWLFGIVS